MDHRKMRLPLIAGTTMALVIAGTAAVSAAPGGRAARGGDDGWFGGGFGPGMMGMRGFGGLSSDVERREVTVTATDGSTTSDRIEQGTATTASDTSLSFTLADGQSVTVAIDSNTSIIGLQQQTVTRGMWHRDVMAPTQIMAADIVAGDEVVVQSTSSDGADYVAERIYVQSATSTDSSGSSSDSSASPEASPSASAETASADA
jgi:hypothetical protein